MSTFDLFSSYYEENQEVNPAAGTMGRRQGRAGDKKKRRTKPTSKKEIEEADPEVEELEETEITATELSNELKGVSGFQEKDLFETGTSDSIIPDESHSEENEATLTSDHIESVEIDENESSSDLVDEQILVASESEMSEKMPDQIVESEHVSHSIETQVESAELEKEPPTNEIEFQEEDQEQEKVFETESFENPISENEDLPSTESINSTTDVIKDEISTTSIIQEKQKNEVSENEPAVQKPVMSLKKPSFGLAKVLQRKDDLEEQTAAPSQSEITVNEPSKEEEKPVSKPFISLKKLVEEKSKEISASSNEDDVDSIQTDEVSEQKEVQVETFQTVTETAEETSEEIEIPNPLDNSVSQTEENSKSPVEESVTTSPAEIELSEINQELFNEETDLLADLDEIVDDFIQQEEEIQQKGVLVAVLPEETEQDNDEHLAEIDSIVEELTGELASDSSETEEKTEEIETVDSIEDQEADVIPIDETTFVEITDLVSESDFQDSEITRVETEPENHLKDELINENTIEQEPVESQLDSIQIQPESSIIEPEVVEEKPKKRSIFNLNKLFNQSETVKDEPKQIDIAQNDELPQVVESESEVKPPINQETIPGVLDKISAQEKQDETNPDLEKSESEVFSVTEEITEDVNSTFVESKTAESKEESNEDEDEPRKVVLPGIGSLKKRLNPGFQKSRPFQMPVLPKRISELESEKLAESVQKHVEVEDEKKVIEPVKEVIQSDSFNSEQIEEVNDSILDEIISEEVDLVPSETEPVTVEVNAISVDEVDESIIDEIDNLIAEVEKPIHQETTTPMVEVTDNEATEPSLSDDWLNDIDDVLELNTSEKNEATSGNTELPVELNDAKSQVEVEQEKEPGNEDEFVLDDVDFSDLFDQLIENVIEDNLESDFYINTTAVEEPIEEKKPSTAKSLHDAIEQIDKSIHQIESISEDSVSDTTVTAEDLDSLINEITEPIIDETEIKSDLEKEPEEEVSLAELFRREIKKATESDQNRIEVPHTELEVESEPINIFGDNETKTSDLEQEPTEATVENSETEIKTETSDSEIAQITDDEPDWYVKLVSGINEKNAVLQQETTKSEDVAVDDNEEYESESVNETESTGKEQESAPDPVQEDWLVEFETQNIEQTASEIDAANTDETVEINKQEHLSAEEKEKSGWTPKSSVEIPIYISNSIREKTKDEESKKARGKFAKKLETKSESNGDQMPLPDFDPLAVYKGMFRRWLIINRHTIGLFAGGLIAFRNALPKSRTRGMKFLFTRIAAAFVKPFLAKELRDKSFAVQLRRRLELMGPTYIKLGQILALREDILPTVVTEELKNLLDRLPQIPFADIKGIIEAELGVPVETCFKEVNRTPIGTASIAQTHFATTIDNEKVVLKVVKPGIRDSILTDIRLLKLISGFLQWAIPQYQPKMLIDEFCAYTEKEVDLTNEADHAEIFAANFTEMEGVRFPKIYREFSGADVLCMEFMDGYKPGAPRMQELSLEEREYLVDRGAASIIQMLYKDGFFHADLHPGNLMILQGPELGFIDLGMVGRFEDKTRRRMLYYFHALVTGDIEGATKYLLAMAKVGEGGDPQGFRRAVADVLRRYYMHSQSGDFSLGRLILNSLSIGGKYRVFFPVEMTLMVKALVTFEGVGYMLVPRLDVPALSEKYVSKIFRDQFNPKAITHELMRGTPELVDMLVQLPKISADGLKFLEEFMNDRSPSNPLEGVKSAIIAGSLLVGGVIAFVQDAHMGVYLSLLGLSGLFALFGK